MRRPLGTLVVIAAAWAAPSARAEGPAAKRLRRPIDVNFVATPLERALENVCRQANVAVVLDKAGLGRGARRFPVSLQARRRPAREVLELLTKEAGVAYRLDGHVVFVTSVQRATHDEVVMRIYDVRDLTGDVPDFPGPHISVDPGPAQYRRAAGGLCIVGGAEHEGVTATGLAEMIRERVRPGLWAAELGTSIEERGGNLVVRQTEDVHAEIDALLEKFRAGFGPFVRIETKAFRADASGLAGALRGAANPGFLTPAERARLEDGLSRLAAATVASARTVCMNNQRTHVFSGVLSDHVLDLEASGDMLDPVVRQLANGMTMDVAPVVSHDRSHIRLEIRLTANFPGRDAETYTVLQRSAVAVGSQTLSLDSSSDKDSSRSKLSRSVHGDAHVPGPARMQGMELVTRRVRTDVYVPDRTTAYFTISLPGNGGDRVKVLLFLVRPKMLAWVGAD
jgi:hypothetical protein